MNRDENYTFYIKAGTFSALMDIDATALRMLTTQMAANVLYGIPDYPSTQDDEFPKDGPGATVHAYMTRWGSNGPVNAFQAQVSFIYGVAELLTSLPKDSSFLNMFLFDDGPEMMSLLIKALTIYQAWKTRVCRDGQDKYGENWGTATGFFTMDWTDLNEKLRELVINR